MRGRRIVTSYKYYQPFFIESYYSSMLYVCTEYIKRLHQDGMFSFVMPLEWKQSIPEPASGVKTAYTWIYLVGFPFTARRPTQGGDVEGGRRACIPALLQ